MARAREKDKAAKDQQPAPDDEAETPWYQFTDWWTQDGDPCVSGERIRNIATVEKDLDWAVVPGSILRELVLASDQLSRHKASEIQRLAQSAAITSPSTDADRYNARQFEILARDGVAKKAWELLLELVRTQPVWSPRYVEEAWTGAEAFVARAKSRQPQPTNSIEDGETSDGH